MAPQRKGLTETQIGAIAENLVGTQLILLSEGRLSPYLTLADDSGIDLLVRDKKTGKIASLQVKSRTKSIKGGPTVHFEVRKATFNPNQNAYLLAIFFKLDERSIERAWLIPMNKLKSEAKKPRKKLVIRPSIKETSQDKYRAFQCKGMPEVVSRLKKDLGK